MKINYVTNSELCNIIYRNIYKVPRDIDGIIAIPRGGLFYGTILSEILRKPLYTIDSFANGIDLGGGYGTQFNLFSNHNRYLVVDDSVSSGSSIKNAKERLKDFDCQYIYSCIVGNDDYSEKGCDIVLEIVNEFRIFELNLWRSSLVSDMMFDFDGVLCVDPVQDTDEEEYIEFLKTAKPLFPIAFPIGAIVTHRLFKYVEYCKEWLANNGIQYHMLYALTANSIEEKIKMYENGALQRIKGEMFLQDKSKIMFVESNFEESKNINMIARKPVLCTATNSIIQTY